MTTAESTNTFADSGLARLLALVIAILLGWLLWSNWTEDFKQLVSGESNAPAAVVSATEPAKPANAALEACLEQRVGDVDRMKEEGILTEEKYAAFKSRAVSLCRAQNPGG